MTQVRFGLFAAFFAAAALSSAAASPGAAGQAGSPPGQAVSAAEDGFPDDGYTVWLCPMHRDHQAAAEGRCALCGMAFVRRTLVTRHVCLGVEDGVAVESPGVCPETGEPLVPATREVVWSCPGAPDRFFFEPGVCESGAPRERSTRPSEHGDHNPRHGGILFMAPNGEHHLEGALEDGRFRLYFYDSFTRPLPSAPFEARLVPADEMGDPAGAPLALTGTPDALDDALETAVSRTPGERAAFTAFVRFPDREDEDRFDFIFLSEAERAALAAAAGGGNGPPAPLELRTPDDPQELLDAIRERDRRVQALIAAGRWADLFIPALEAKQLALAYGERAAERPWAALKRIVRGAWLLDLHGDRGDRVRVGEAYEIFAEGMRGLPQRAPDGGGGA